jgi:hypothetical protein
MKTCSICAQKSDKIFNRKVLSKYDVDFYYCKNCHFIFSEDPYWLEEAYSHSITDTDIGYIGRNILMSRITLILFYFLFDKKDRFLDYAGGYGIFTRLMNDSGLEFHWADTYTPNLFAQGLEYNNEKIRAVTCFEAFEHFVDPIAECKKIIDISPTVFLSTTLLPNNKIPDPDTWGYYSFHHGQHIAFYSQQALTNIAHTLGLRLYTNRKNLHLLTYKKINNTFFKFLLGLSKLQIDLILRKIIKY